MGKKDDLSLEIDPKDQLNEELLSAFRSTYGWVVCEEKADEVFTLRRLREYFMCYPSPRQGDLLPYYLERLDEMGYHTTTAYDGQPAIMCLNMCRKHRDEN
jgi:hypothetical protein